MLGIGGESNAVRPKVPCKQSGCAALVEPGNKYCEMLESVEKVPIVIPAKARKIFDIKQGDNLVVLGDEGQGIALMKEENLLQMLNVADGED